MNNSLYFIKKNKALVFVLMIFLCLQLAFVLIGGISPSSDGNDYAEFVEETMARDGIYPSKVDFIYPYIWNAGFINLIVLCIKLFGSLESVLVVHSIMNTFSALFLFLFTQKITNNRKIAWIALLLFVTYLSNFAHAASLLTEVSFFFFIISGFYFSISSKKTHSLLGGICFAIANWVRPLLILFIPILIYHLYREKKIKKLALISIGLIVTIFIIGGDTYMRTGRFIFQANTSWYNIAMTCDDSASGTFYGEVFEKGQSMYIEKRDTMDYKDVTKILKERSVNYILNNPLKMIAQIPNRFLRFYINDTSCMWAFVQNKKSKTEQEIINEGATVTLLTKFPHYSSFQYILIYSQIFYYFILFTFILGLIKAYKNKYTQILTPFLIILAGTILTIAVISINRYHHPFIPFMMIISAYYLHDLKFIRMIHEKK